MDRLYPVNNNPFGYPTTFSVAKLNIIDSDSFYQVLSREFHYMAHYTLAQDLLLRRYLLPNMAISNPRILQSWIAIYLYSSKLIHHYLASLPLDRELPLIPRYYNHYVAIDQRIALLEIVAHAQLSLELYHTLKPYQEKSVKLPSSLSYRLYYLQFLATQAYREAIIPQACYEELSLLLSKLLTDLDQVSSSPDNLSFIHQVRRLRPTLFPLIRHDIILQAP